MALRRNRLLPAVAATTIALLVGTGIWVWAKDRQESGEEAIANSELHQVILEASGNKSNAAIEKFLPRSFDRAVAVLAQAAEIRQPFSRPIRTYGKLDISPTRAPRGHYQPVNALQFVLKWSLKIEPSTVRAGTCAELWFPNRTLFGEPTRLPVYLFDMKDRSNARPCKPPLSEEQKDVLVNTARA